MKLVFDSLEELHAFYAEVFDDSATDKPRRTRRSKKDTPDGVTSDAAQAQVAPVSVPAPLQPPADAPVFAPPAQPAATPMAFPAAAAPEVNPTVAKIIARRDSAIGSGASSADGALAWFREQCGAQAAQATMEQIDQFILPKLPAEALANIAKWMGITA